MNQSARKLKKVNCVSLTKTLPEESSKQLTRRKKIRNLPSKTKQNVGVIQQHEKH